MSKAAKLKRFNMQKRPQVEVFERLRKLQEEYLGDLEQEDFQAVVEHLEGPYMSMDHGYQGYKYGTPQLAEHLDAIIAGAPRTREHMSVYRGTSPERFVPKHGYPMTTTIEPGHAEMYAEGWASPEEPGYLAEILVPPRSPALLTPTDEFFQKKTGELPPFGDEREILLPPPRGPLDVIRRYLRDEFPGERETFMEYETLQYKPPYKARGGLIDGHT